MRSRFAATVALAAALTFVLQGCSLGAEPTATTSPDTAIRSTPRPTPTPTQTAARIELGPQYTRAVTKDGVELWRIGYDEDPAQAVAQISVTLGAPTQTEHDGTSAGDVDLPATDYDWNGLELRSPHYSGEQPSGDGYSDYSISVTAAVSHGVELVTSSGIAIGTTRADLAAVSSAYTTRPSPSSADWTYLESWTRDHSGDAITDWVAVHLDGDHVSRLFGTFRSYGA